MAVSDLITTGLFISTVYLAAPIAIPALGGLISDKSGMPNVALEGIMSVGAFVAVVFCVSLGPWMAIFIAACAGAFMSFLLGFICIKGQGNLVVGGFAINFVCWGLIPVLSMIIYHAKGMTPRVDGFLSIIENKEENEIFFKTIYPSRGYTKKYLGRRYKNEEK